MRIHFIIFHLLFTSFFSFSQGIIWEANINDAFKKAKASNKIVFIECYLTTCPVCQSFEPILKSKEVGTFYNKNFINFKLNGAIASQVKFLNDKHIWLPSFPMLLFFDGNGNIIHQSDAGEPKAESLIELSKNALNPNKRASNYKKRYENGDREFNFLLNYAYYSRCLMDTLTTINISNSLYDNYPKEELNSEVSWTITKKVVVDIDNGFAKHWLNNVNIAKQYELKHGHPNGESNTLGQIIQTSLYSPRGWNYSSAKLNSIKEYMSTIGFSEFIEGATWQHETKALLRENQPIKALELINAIAQKNVTNGASLVYITSFFIDNFNDLSYMKYPQDWLNQAKSSLNGDNYWTDYYFQSARLCMRTGEIDNAKKNLREAKKHALLAKISLKKIEDLEIKLK